MKKRIAYLMLPVCTLILEILPYGSVCNFANPQGTPWRKTFAYFDLTPFGYANFGPFLTAVATCLILSLLLLYVFTGKTPLVSVIQYLLGISVVFSLCPLLLGIRFFSLIGALITVSLIAEWVILFLTVKTPMKNKGKRRYETQER